MFSQLIDMRVSARKRCACRASTCVMLGARMTLTDRKFGVGRQRTADRCSRSGGTTDKIAGRREYCTAGLLPMSPTPPAWEALALRPVVYWSVPVMAAAATAWQALAFRPVVYWSVPVMAAAATPWQALALQLIVYWAVPVMAAAATAWQAPAPRPIVYWAVPEMAAAATA
jgi:hypothetical protein